LILDDRELDLSMREADIAIRMTPPRQGDLIQRHILTSHMHAYASTGYIKRYGMPKEPHELDKHRIIVYGEDKRPPVPEVNWLLKMGQGEHSGRRAVMTVNNVYAIMRAVMAGAGIGALPEFMVQSDG